MPQLYLSESVVGLGVIGVLVGAKVGLWLYSLGDKVGAKVGVWDGASVVDVDDIIRARYDNEHKRIKFIMISYPMWLNNEDIIEWLEIPTPSSIHAIQWLEK